MVKKVGAAAMETIPRSTNPCRKTRTVPINVMQSNAAVRSLVLSAKAVKKGTARKFNEDTPNAMPI